MSVVEGFNVEQAFEYLLAKRVTDVEPDLVVEPVARPQTRRTFGRKSRLNTSVNAAARGDCPMM